MPLFTMSPISASSSPFPCLLTQPMGKTLTTDRCRAWETMYSVTLWLSFQGSVLGITAMEVNPPAAAAAPPVSMVSSSSRPGSLRWTCMSMNPGATTLPARSRTGTLSTGIPGATRAIFPSRIRTSWTRSRSPAGSTTRPPLSSQFTGGSSREQVEHRHPDRHAVGDLIQDDRVGPVRDFAGDLHAPVHGSRVHQDHVLLRQANSLLREPIEVEVLPQRGESAVAHSLPLNPEHHHHVAPFQSLFNPRFDLHSQTIQAHRKERRRPSDHHGRAQLFQKEKVGTNDPAVRDIAHDGDPESSDLPLFLPHGERVEEGLRGMLVRAVACIDDVGSADSGHEAG